MDANNRRARATDEAAQWWTRLGTKAPADVSETDRQEYTRWLRESPLHVAELLQIAHVHDTLERFESWREILVLAEEDYDTNIVYLNPDSKPFSVSGAREGPAQREQSPATPSAKTAEKRGRGPRFFIAASICLIAVTAGWLVVRLGTPTIETDRAERREVVLSDGSIVNLEPETQLRVSLGKHQRYVALTRGRALFHVAKDPTRPFIVHAGDIDVRAVGTIFGVEQRNQNIIVTVSEGKVGVVPAVTEHAFSPPARSNSSRSTSGEKDGPAAREGAVNYGETGSLDPARASRKSQPRPFPSNAARGGRGSGISSDQPGEIFLTANQQITVRKSGDATPVQKVESSRALAWSEGRLVFDSAPLSDVADEFNHYNRVQLRIDSPELARRTVSGMFRASDPETLIDFIGAGAHVVVTRQGNEEIVISPAP